MMNQGSNEFLEKALSREKHENKQIEQVNDKLQKKIVQENNHGKINSSKNKKNKNKKIKYVNPSDSFMSKKVSEEITENKIPYGARANEPKIAELELGQFRSIPEIFLDDSDSNLGKGSDAGKCNGSTSDKEKSKGDKFDEGKFGKGKFEGDKSNKRQTLGKVDSNTSEYPTSESSASPKGTCRLLKDTKKDLQRTKSCASTLSIISSDSDNSSIYLDNDYLISICIEKIKIEINKLENNYTQYEQAFCVSYFAYEDPLELFSLFQGINWLPELRNRCTSANLVEYSPKENIKKSICTVHVNFHQCVNLKSRKNEFLNITDNNNSSDDDHKDDDDIIYVFISVVGIHLKEFGESHYYKIYDRQNFAPYFNNIDLLLPFSKKNANDMGMEKITKDECSRWVRSTDSSRGISNDRNASRKAPCMHKEINSKKGTHMFNGELVEAYKKELQEEAKSMESKKIIIEGEYVKFLKILGSCIIPINVSNKNILKTKQNKKKKKCDSYNLYSHATIRLLLDRYLDHFKRNRKVNLFHLVNKYEKELIPIGNIKLILDIKSETHTHDTIDTEYIARRIHNTNSNIHDCIDKILKYVKIKKKKKKTILHENGANDKNGLYREEDKICSIINTELMRIENNYLKKSYSYIEKNLQKIYNPKEQEEFNKRVIRNIFQMLEMTKRGASNRSSYNLLFNSSCSFSPYEIVCSHVIIRVHYVSNIALQLSSLNRFIDKEKFYIIIYWAEEGDTMHNIENIKLRRTRIIDLQMEKGIELDYYFVGGKDNNKYELLNDKTYEKKKKKNFVSLKLNFNSCVILPYNYNAPSCAINMILFQKDIPLLELTENIIINDDIPFNNGCKIKKELKIHHSCDKKEEENFIKDSFNPYVEISFYTHPKHSTFFSSDMYKLFYEGKMKCTLDDTTHASYSAPVLNRGNIIFLFFDDFINNLSHAGINKEKKENIQYSCITNFFIPITQKDNSDVCTNVRTVQNISNGVEKNKRVLHNNHFISKCKKKDNNTLLLKKDTISYALAEGLGLMGGEINKWLSFYVYTKNYKNENIYCGTSVTIRIQVEPVGCLKSQYGIDSSKNGKVVGGIRTIDNDNVSDKNNITRGNNDPLRPFSFCFKPLNDIYETTDYQVKDFKNGTYQILYKINKVGKKLLHIYCDGINIIGSPYEIYTIQANADSKFSKILGSGATRCLATPVFNFNNVLYNDITDAKMEADNGRRGGSTYTSTEKNSMKLRSLCKGKEEFEEDKENYIEGKIKQAENNTQVPISRSLSKGVKSVAITEEEKSQGRSNSSIITKTRQDNTSEHRSNRNLHEITMKQNDFPHKVHAEKENTNSLKNNTLNIHSDNLQRDDLSQKETKYSDANFRILNCSEYSNQGNEDIINIDKMNRERYKNFMKNIYIVNTFTIVLYDHNGERISIGNDNVKVVGRKGAYIKNVVDNNDGSYEIEYICYFKKEENTTRKKNNINGIKKEDIINFYNEFLFQENKYYDNVIINEFEKRFNDVPIYCEINVYVNEIQIFGCPLKPIITNVHNILEFYNLYDQHTYSGLLLKNFELLLYSNNYQNCMHRLLNFYKNFLDHESEYSYKKLLSLKVMNEQVENVNFFFTIPLNISELKKGALIRSTLPIDKLTWDSSRKHCKIIPNGKMPFKEEEWEKEVITPFYANLNNCRVTMPYPSSYTNVPTYPTEEEQNSVYYKRGVKNKFRGEKRYIGKNWISHNDEIGEEYSSKNCTSEQDEYFLNEWLYMHKYKEHMSDVNKKHDLSMHLAYSLSNIILHHLIYLKKYKYFINSKQYENDLLQNNILTQFKNLLKEEYNKMFAYQTNNIINYCNKIGNAKFSSLEELIKVYKSIAFELRRLKKNDLADDFDKCCENMCEELYLQNIEASLKRKELKLDQYEKMINEKVEKLDQIKNDVKKYEDKYNVDIEKVSKLCSVKMSKGIQTCDYLSYKHSFLSSLIESRNVRSVQSGQNGQSEKNEWSGSHMSNTNKDIFILVRKYWKNASTYDIFTTIKNTLKNCPRLKISLDETFNYYSCSIKKDNKMKDFQIKKMQEIKVVENLDNLKKIELNEEELLTYNELNNFYLTYNAYVALIIDLKCNKYFIKDLDNVLYLFEKFSVEHNSFRQLYNPYGLLRVIPKYLFIAFVRELAYLNMLYVLAEYVVDKKEDEKIYLSLNHPSRLSSFHYFIKYHFIDFYDKLSMQSNFQNYKQHLIELNKEDIEGESTKDTSTHIHINLYDLETYFNNELPLIVKHKNFSKTFPLLFDYYSKLSTCQGEVNKMDMQKDKEEENKLTENNMDKKYVSITIFIRFLREFGLIPHFFSNHIAIQILQSFMKNKKKLNYEHFSYAIILAISECVKKNILTQYNMLKVNNQLNSKIQTDKILNYSYIAYEAKELIYLFGLADMHIVKSKISY
ncbi:conserved Plasmodium protein, unknown function [Plasmodium malariae]|uniref:Uncharacterized protein n=1 Tax=Plasmodium malariae TaxID=5858 RepID=A0A1D3PBM7_PLAMA|nr:conserved Plasmodium protein, unknown function [Plasmodium malariae]SCN12669.1 conserved Plasmodium protein, unknown function [Plasmodium malariae]